MNSMRSMSLFFESAVLRLARVACPVLLLLIALVKLGQKVKWPAWQKWMGSWLDLFAPWTFMAFWVLILAVVALLFLMSIRMGRSGNLLVLRTHSGFPLKIRESAINRFVHDRLESLPFIKSSRIEARGVGGALEVRGRIWVSCSERIDDLHNQVCDRIVEDTKRALGITKVLTPKLVFEDMESGAAGDQSRDSLSIGPGEAPTLLAEMPRPAPAATGAAERPSLWKIFSRRDDKTDKDAGADADAAEEARKDA